MFRLECSRTKCHFYAAVRFAGADVVLVSQWRIMLQHDFSKACFTRYPIMGSPVEQTHWSRASWEINKLSVSCWWYEVELCPMGLRGALRQCSWPRIVCPIHQWPATTAYLQTEIVWRWHHLSVPHLHSWRSSNTPKWSKQFLYG